MSSVQSNIHTAGNGTRIWVLWDGDCGFCRHSIDWLKARDKNNALYAVAYQLAPTPPMTPEIYAACAKAVHIILPDGTVMRAGRAALFALKMIGWGAVAVPLSLPPFIWAVELGYKIVAANRGFFSRVLFPKAGSDAVCALPPRPAAQTQTDTK